MARHLTAERGWLALLAAILAYEVACDDGEMLSHGMDRLIERHPVWPRVAVTLVALHLVNAIPRRLDVMAVAFDATRRLGGLTAWVKPALNRRKTAQISCA